MTNCFERENFFCRARRVTIFRTFPNQIKTEFMNIKKIAFVFALIGFISSVVFAAPPFVRVKNGQLFIGDKSYYFIGTNYWYGTLLGLEKDKRRGIERLRKELDF